MSEFIGHVCKEGCHPSHWHGPLYDLGQQLTYAAQDFMNNCGYGYANGRWLVGWLVDGHSPWGIPVLDGALWVKLSSGMVGVVTRKPIPTPRGWTWDVEVCVLENPVGFHGLGETMDIAIENAGRWWT